MKFWLKSLSLILVVLTGAPTSAEVSVTEPLRVVQLVTGDTIRRNHPEGLPSLLNELNSVTGIPFSPDPIFIQSFEDERLFDSPIVYVNFADRRDWILSPLEVQRLQHFLDRGGFLYLDAGINAAFLRDNPALGQGHSFADWEITPILAEQFARIFPSSPFQPLPRSHPVFSAFYEGLPDPEALPDAIRDYIVNEKWPEGTYSALGIHHPDTGRLAILATPVISLGWGRDRFGRWTNPIAFRVRETSEGMDDRLATAAYSGQRFEVTREDGRKDIIFCQPANTPAWVREPDGRWRVFRYHQGEEISNYAHQFYTQLGINFFLFALTQS